MNKHSPSQQRAIKDAKRPKKRIFIDRVQLRVHIVARNEIGLFQVFPIPWLLTARDDVTDTVALIVTLRRPTADDVLSIMNKSAKSTYRPDIHRPPELSYVTNHGISEIYIDSSADLSTGAFYSACFSSGFVVVVSTNALQKTQTERLLGKLDAALRVTRASRVGTVEPIDGHGDAPLMGSAAVTTDELCQELRNIFGRNLAPIEVEVGRREYRLSVERITG